MDVRVRRRSLASSEPCLSINSSLCCPRSLWKMKSVYHCDWHRIVSPSFFFPLTHTHTRHLRALPLQPSPPLHHSDTHRHTHTLVHIHPSGTDSIRQRSSNSISSQCAMCCGVHGCATATPVRWARHAAAPAAGGGNSHVCVVNVCRCNGNTAGKLLHCVGQRWECSVLPGKSRSGNDEALMGWQ